MTRMYSKLSRCSPLLQEALPVDFTSQRPEPRRRLLRRDIPLWLSQQLVSHKELAHRRGAQKGRVKVHVEIAVLGLFLCAVEGCLVDARTWYRQSLRSATVFSSRLEGDWQGDATYCMGSCTQTNYHIVW